MSIQGRHQHLPFHASKTLCAASGTLLTPCRTVPCLRLGQEQVCAIEAGFGGCFCKRRGKNNEGYLEKHAAFLFREHILLFLVRSFQLDSKKNAISNGIQ